MKFRIKNTVFWSPMLSNVKLIINDIFLYWTNSN